MLGFFGLGALARGFTADQLFAPDEIAFLQKVWPTIRVAAKWTDPNWGSIGFPNGPLVSARASQILDYTWGLVRPAAQFSDINWKIVPVPDNLLPAPVTQPVPEVVASPPTASDQPVSPTTMVRTPEASPTAQNPALDTPAAQNVPEAQQATTPYVDGPSTPVGTSAGSGFDVAAWLAQFTGGTPAQYAASPDGSPVTPSAAVTQAGMFGNLKTWALVSAVGLGLYFMSGAHKTGRRGKRGRRRARA